MKSRKAVLGGLLLAWVVIAGALARGDSTPGKTAGKGDVHDSPRAAYLAAQAASKKGDIPGFIACLTADSEKLLAGELAARGLMLRGLASLDQTGKAKEKLEPLDKVLAKYGITEEMFKKAAPARAEGQIGKALRSIGAQVKDRPAFCAEFFEAWEKATPNRRPRPFLGVELANVKVSGDRATGTMVAKINETDKKEEPIAFARVDGSWKIVLPEPKSPAPGKPAGPR
jgi:hypothetical protein